MHDICRDKLVILVTHDLNLASRMDKVIYIQSKNNQCHIMDADEFQVQIDELREHLGPNLSNQPAQVESDSETLGSQNQPEMTGDDQSDYEI